MPEIKNAFTQGRMNKDFDERLVPSGQYRDALNVSVAASDNAGAGTVRNLLGNIRVDTLVGSDGYTCVGSVADERTNKLYWFIHNEELSIDAILEYNKVLDTSQVLLMDPYFPPFTRILKFTGKQITGINVVDNFLFWSDGDSEPKKINISRAYHENLSSLALTSSGNPQPWVPRLHVNGELTDTLLKEEHITVIKKKPTSAPTVKLISAKGEVGSAIFEKVFLRFCIRYKYADGEYSAFSPFTDIVFNPEYDEQINSTNAYSTDEPYNKSMINLIKSIELYDFVALDMPDDVVQIDILYKQEDSPNIYSIENIKLDSSEANALGSGQFNIDASGSSYKGKYVITSENIHAVLPSNQLLRASDAVPKSALGQEIVGNRLVYANYKQGYNFIDNIPTIDADYSLRSSQDFSKGGLKSIKSQRKYQLGYLLGDEYGRETPIFTSRQAGINIDWSSSNYGSNASNSTMFNARLFGDLPDWASYYKFYVKSSSDEYYNLLMDKSYFPFTHNEFENKDDHIYISFPSSDRNKIMEDDYIIAKKIYDSSSSQVFEENKYKILDINNEAPDAVKYIFFSLGSVQNNTDNILCSGVTDFSASSLFAGPQVIDSVGARIDQQSDIIHLHKTGWLSSSIDGAPLIEADEKYNKDVFISWNVGDLYSQRYQVSSVRISGSSENVYILKLTSKISEKDARLAAYGDSEVLDFDTLANNTQYQLDADLVFKCERRQTRSEEDFSGKFFVKIKHNDYLTGNDQSSGIYTVEEAKTYWLFGEHNASTDFTESTGIINSASESFNLDGAVTVAASTNIPGVTGFANTPLDWSNIKDWIGDSFFIDDMNFIASNPMENQQWFAKEAGEGWKGTGTVYPDYQWGSIGVPLLAIYDSQASTINTYHWRQPVTGSSSLMGGNLDTSYGFAPYPAYKFTNSDDVIDVGERIINSLEGIVTTNTDHSWSGIPSVGMRRWQTGSLYDDVYSEANVDDTYGPENESGRYFMHLSFLAPGVDLIDTLDSSYLDGVKIKGYDSIASKLQGIWGGGVFTKTPNVALDYVNKPEGGTNPEAFGSLTVSHDGSLTDGGIVEFEGNYTQISFQHANSDIQTYTMPASPGPGVGQGYDTNYTLRHQQQWNPAYSDAGHNQEIEDFVTRLKTPGTRFKFKGDTALTPTIYTILSISEKHIYNHTSWRMRWLYNAATESFEASENSVEEAASKWADFTGNDLTPSNSSDSGYDQAATDLANAITNFGRAHNRRTCFIIELDKDPEFNYDPRTGTNDIDADYFTQIEIVTDIAPSLIDSLFIAPTVWETEPQQLTDLNIYYEASNNIPTKITSKTNELFAPVGSEVKGLDTGEPVYITEWVAPTKFKTSVDLPEDVSYIAATLEFCRYDGSYVNAVVAGQEDENIIEIEEKVNAGLSVGLNWFNCFSFGDGIESNRIRDGFNKMQISNGARVSATLEQPFIEEHRTNGLIYSGIYNSNSSVNNLNQFIAAEKITKDINPTYGSIQKLFTRNTDLVALCEDRVLKILANKDALFNADGDPQLVATNNVLGQSVPFSGDFGISTHPESFAKESYRAYFTDKQRGAVLRLSMDGLTPISDAGMREYFRDNLVDQANFIGSYDAFNKQYNLTIKKEPILGNTLVEYFSEGATPTEYTMQHIEHIDDGTFTQGLSFSGVMQLEDLPLEERTITQNSTLEGSVTIINHPLIDTGGLVPSQAIMTDPPEDIEEITIEDVDITDIDDPNWDFFYNNIVVEYTDTFEQGNFTMFGFEPTDLVGDNQVGDPFSPYYGFGSTDAKFYINRFTNTNASGGPATIEMTGGYYGNDFDLGFGGTSQNNNYSGDPNEGEWASRVYCFASTGITSIPGSNQVSSYSVDTENAGITFRGSPANNSGHTPWGYIEFPVSANNPDGPQGPINVNGFVSGGTSGVPAMVLEQEPTALNNTIFNGEEIKVTFKYRANNYGDNVQNYFKLTLLDGADTLDESILQTTDEYAQNVDPDFNTFTGSSTTTFGTIHPSSGIHNEDKEEILFFKFWPGFGSDLGGIGIQNLRFKIELWSDGTNSTDDLEDMGETVITGFKMEKVHRLISQDYELPDVEIDPDNQTASVFIDNTPDPEVIGYTDPIPLEPIPAWAEVIYPDAIDGFVIPGSSANIDWGLEDQFGPENPGELIPYIDLDGNEQTYLSGSNNGVTPILSTWEYLETTAPIEGGHNINNSNFKALLDPTKPLEFNKWYMVELKVAQLNNFNTNPIIQLQGGSTGTTTYPFFVDSPDNLQIATYDSNYKIILGDIETLPSGEMVYRGLFKLQPQSPWSNSPASLISSMHVSLYSGADGFNNSVFEEIRLIDISAEATGGSADNWNINPSLYQIERAAIPGTTTIPQSHPSVYYQNGQINFSSSFENVIASTFSTERSFAQQLPVLPEVNDHYELVVQYGNDAISGSFNSNENAMITINVGDSEFTNVDLVMPNSGSISYYYGPINFNGEPTEIVFTADNQFIGSIKSVSLKDMTNYFSAGSVGSWVIEGNTTMLNAEGEEVIVENYISWNEGQIYFAGATTGSKIYQQIEELPVGQSFEISFDSFVNDLPTAGALKVSYINADGTEIFEQVITQSDNGNNMYQFTVGETDALPPQSPASSIVFQAIGNIPTYGTIDNLVLRRVITDEEFGIPEQTISYNEDVKGWVSFKSFIPERGISLSNRYFTFNDGQLWRHDANDSRNSFYGINYNSSITTVLNNSPSLVKDFNTINYEGSEGWVVEEITTDLDRGYINEFIKKENKWFNYIKGSTNNLDTSKFNVQGLGMISHTTEE